MPVEKEITSSDQLLGHEIGIDDPDLIVPKHLLRLLRVGNIQKENRSAVVRYDDQIASFRRPDLLTAPVPRHGNGGLPLENAVVLNFVNAESIKIFRHIQSVAADLCVEGEALRIVLQRGDFPFTEPNTVNAVV